MPETFSENMNNRYDNLNIRFQHMQHKKNRCLPQKLLGSALFLNFCEHTTQILQ